MSKLCITNARGNEEFREVVLPQVKCQGGLNLIAYSPHLQSFRGCVTGQTALQFERSSGTTVRVAQQLVSVGDQVVAALIFHLIFRMHCAVPLDS